MNKQQEFEQYLFHVAEDIILFVDKFHTDLRKISCEFDYEETKGNVFELDLIKKVK